MKKTLYDKLFDLHVVKKDGNNYIIKIDRMPGHEVTSAQAFSDMQEAHRTPWNKNQLLFVEDHNTPTDGGYETITDKNSKEQLDTLRANIKKYKIDKFFPLLSEKNGIVHVVSTERGFILPGTSAVCGDSHTATYGAIASLAFGVGTSEVSTVLQTGVLKVEKLKNMRITVNGKLNKYVTPKDVILYIIGQISTSGGTGYAIEFAGDVFEQMSIEGRMTVCNMAIEAGAKVGLVAVDQKTLDYVRGREFAPKDEEFERFSEFAKNLKSDDGAEFDKEYIFDASDIEPQVTYGTNPAEVVGISQSVPSDAPKSSLEYMGLKPNQKISSIPVEYVFLGSCTNARFSDLEIAAQTLKKINKKKHESVKQVLIVLGSMEVKRKAEEKGYDKIFIDAGFEWRNPGCSACLAMNNDIMPSGKHVASTSNRNFRDRQGKGARTHLVSPIIAMIAATHGRFVDNLEDILN